MSIFILIFAGLLATTFLCSYITHQNRWEKELEDAEQEAYLSEYRRTHRKN